MIMKRLCGRRGREVHFRGDSRWRWPSCGGAKTGKPQGRQPAGAAVRQPRAMCEARTRAPRAWSGAPTRGEARGAQNKPPCLGTLLVIPRRITRKGPINSAPYFQVVVSWDPFGAEYLFQYTRGLVPPPTRRRPGLPAAPRRRQCEQWREAGRGQGGGAAADEQKE